MMVLSFTAAYSYVFFFFLSSSQTDIVIELI
jgi:hypothetical protein